MNGLNIFIGAIFLFILIMIIVKTISQFKEKKKSQEKEENKELNFNSHTIASIKDNSIELKCNNILNQTYSNYLNNLRYFSPQEAGRNITVQYSFNF